MTLTQGHGSDTDKQKFACVRDKVRTTLLITTKLSSYIPLVMLITWLDFGGFMLETLFFANLSTKTSIDVKQETKRRCIGWILGELCDLDLWPHPWPWPWKYKFETALFEEWGGGGGGAERKGCESTMVGWVDVQYSDWADFRRRRAVDMPSFWSRDNCWRFYNTKWIHLIDNLYKGQFETTLTHLLLVPHICVNESGWHWFR